MYFIWHFDLVNSYREINRLCFIGHFATSQFYWIHSETNKNSLRISLIHGKLSTFFPLICLLFFRWLAFPWLYSSFKFSASFFMQIMIFVKNIWQVLSICPYIHCWFQITTVASTYQSKLLFGYFHLKSHWNSVPEIPPCQSGLIVLPLWSALFLLQICNLRFWGKDQKYSSNFIGDVFH